MRPVVIGALLGLLATAGVGRALSSMLFGIHPADPLGLGTGIALVVGIALTAGLLAARRAAGVEPLRVLREE
jgi:ABC-type antimicrobial peptide transport system permease subunit